MLSTRIAQVLSREVLDSRGQPTVEVEIVCADGSRGAAIVPSGASTGRLEACELRDGDPSRYDGRGVLKAVQHVREQIGPAIVGLDAAEQAAVDARLCQLDPSPQKSTLGANALLGVSLATAQAAAAGKRVPLFQHLHELWRARWTSPWTGAGPTPAGPELQPRMPLPMTNMISGGLHAGGNLDFQDFLVSPTGAADYAQGLEWIVRVYRRLGNLLRRAGYEGFLVGDEGGFGPRLAENRQALDFVVQAIRAAGLEPGRDLVLNLDVASTHFFDGSHYCLRATGQLSWTSCQMIDYLEQLVGEFPIASIEDPLAEDDWAGWQELTARLGRRVRLVGDDLLVTNRQRLQHAIELQVANSVLIKVNQIGTLSETLDTMQLAVEHGYQTVVSARSGETEDCFMADLAVATAATQIKIGSIVRSERLAKYNRLLRIAEMLPAVR